MPGRTREHDGPGIDSTAAGVLRVSPTLVIPLSELEWHTVPAGGPGGQHANRSSTRVEVRFDVTRSAAVGPIQRSRLLERFGPVVRATAGERRSQSQNRQVALERLAERLAGALRRPPPRISTAPTPDARERRLAEKHRRAQRKQQRRAPDVDD